MTDSGKWKFETRTRFKKQYKNLDHELQEKIYRSMQELRNSENPAYLGKYKQSTRVFAYNVGRKYRIIYNVNWDENIIEFLSVCDHKSVYGRD